MNKQKINEVRIKLLQTQVELERCLTILENELKEG